MFMSHMPNSVDIQQTEEIKMSRILTRHAKYDQYSSKGSKNSGTYGWSIENEEEILLHCCLSLYSLDGIHGLTHIAHIGHKLLLKGIKQQ